VSDNVFR